MGLTAILFPGQGSQTPEMRDTVAELRGDLLALASGVVGEDPFAESPERAGDGSMLALMGRGAAEHALELADANGLAVANDNSPQQVVLPGDRRGFPGAEAAAKELGLGATELPVTGAFHSPTMAEAVPSFAAALEQVEVSRPRDVRVFSAVSAAPFDDVRAQLAQALTMPVRWGEKLLAMHERGAERFVEVGLGRVLTGLVKRTLRGVELAHA